MMWQFTGWAKVPGEDRMVLVVGPRHPEETFEEVEQRVRLAVQSVEEGKMEPCEDGEEISVLGIRSLEILERAGEAIVELNSVEDLIMHVMKGNMGSSLPSERGDGEIGN